MIYFEVCSIGAITEHEPAKCLAPIKKIWTETYEMLQFKLPSPAHVWHLSHGLDKMWKYFVQTLNVVCSIMQIIYQCNILSEFNDEMTAWRRACDLWVVGQGREVVSLRGVSLTDIWSIIAVRLLTDKLAVSKSSDVVSSSDDVLWWWLL